jgi:hypothetical protein
LFFPDTNKPPNPKVHNAAFGRRRKRRIERSLEAESDKHRAIPHQTPPETNERLEGNTA